MTTATTTRCRLRFHIALLCSLALAVTAVPSTVPTAVRMDESPEPDPLIIVMDQPSIPEQTPPVMLEELPASTATEPVVVSVDVMDEQPMPSEQPDDAPVANSTASVPFFAYNIGGEPFGQVQADPVQYVVGETLVFNVPDAAISGANAVIEPVYKSHRYGMLGSVWGYDLPVQQPGYYTCKLHYCETFSEFFTDEPNRTFEVTLVGDAEPDVVHSAEFDVMVELGGQEFTAYDRTFQNIAVESELKLRENPSKGDAFLSGVSCIWTAPLM